MLRVSEKVTPSHRFLKLRTSSRLKFLRVCALELDFSELCLRTPSKAQRFCGAQSLG